MVEITGTLESSVAEEQSVKRTWRIPAISKTVARRRAVANSRVKGDSSPSVANTSKVGSGSVPGQSIYLVEVESER